MVIFFLIESGFVDIFLGWLQTQILVKPEKGGERESERRRERGGREGEKERDIER